MSRHAHGQPAGLTRNQALVHRALAEAEGPLSAYTILDRLRGEGLRAPLQVYRALEKLVERGLVHRLESLNAFVACSHPETAVHDATAFAICDKCGTVSELADARLARRLATLAGEAGYTLDRSTVELRGLCRACRPAAG
ncbi:transcriptional repressor [Aquibium sp. A9E412]|uniref:Fur family transcriptional regulator n=1 Tax=Aquibium sp. A9E412 TaxID=2976767 RepID=UPI0025B0AFDA|nr:Fur family transcriptional regulator [Aquibium sp. A9E412]MDN2564917.1 transcriptional repressor [Aquibium sp. A9E412]